MIRFGETGMRKETACCLIMLLLLQLEACSCHADGFDRLGKLRGGFGTNLGPAASRAGFGGDGQVEGDGVVCDEKRMIYTGPNPLHNR